MRTFKIGNAVTKPIVRNKYRLAVQFMSGDGDHYEVNNYDFDELSELQLTLNVLAAYNSLSWNAQCDISGITKWSELGGFKFNYCANPPQVLDAQQQAFVDFAQGVPSDVQSDGDWDASPDTWKVTYFDEAGDEFEVTVTEEDGTATPMSRQG